MGYVSKLLVGLLALLLSHPSDAFFLDFLLRLSGKSPPVVSSSATLETVAQKVERLRCSIIGFWLEHGPDRQFGGMHATLLRDGSPSSPTAKPLVAQSRHLWSLTSMAAHLQGPTSAVADTAAAQAAFLMRFVDPQDGAFWGELSRDGLTPTNKRKDFVDQAPAIFALAAFGKQFNSPTALQAASRAFQAWDAAVHDPVHGGYADGAVGTASVGGSVAALAASGAALAPGRRKVLNTQLHALLAVADLLRAEPGNTVLQARLRELLEVLSRKMLVQVVLPGNASATAVANTYASDWSDPSVQRDVSFAGMLAEYVWYLRAAADLAEQVGGPELPPAVVAAARAAAAAVSETLVHGGFIDAVNGGWLHGVPLVNGSQPVAGEKYWWVQLEAALAMMSLFRAGGGKSLAHLQLVDDTLKFVMDHLFDERFGELFMVADRSGQLLNETTCGAAGKVDPAAVKACGNKASWHTGRAMLQLYSWLLDAGVQGMTHCNSHNSA